MTYYRIHKVWIIAIAVLTVTNSNVWAKEDYSNPQTHEYGRIQKAIIDKIDHQLILSIIDIQDYERSSKKASDFSELNQKINILKNTIAVEYLKGSFVINVLIKTKNPSFLQGNPKIKIRGEHEGTDVTYLTAVVNLKDIEEIALDENVLTMESAKILHQELNTSTGLINANSIWDESSLNDTNKRITGRNVYVGIIDGLVQWEHETFIDGNADYRVRKLWKEGVGYSQPNIPSFSVEETSDHGTHVAGIAAGDGSIINSEYIGIAFEANLLCAEANNTNDILDAFQWMIDEVNNENSPLTVNLSMGVKLGPHDGTTNFEDALNVKINNDIVFIKSAGNESRDSHPFPHYQVTESQIPDLATEFVEIEFEIKDTSPITNSISLELWSDGMYDVQVGDNDPLATDWSERLMFGTQSVFSFTGYNYPNDGDQIFVFNHGTNSWVYEPGETSTPSNVIAIYYDGGMDNMVDPGTYKIRLYPNSQGSGEVVDGYHSGETVEPSPGIFVIQGGFRDGDSYQSITIPGYANHVITVGAHNNGIDGSLALFSSLGPSRIDALDVSSKPDITAPGVEIMSSVDTGFDHYQNKQGTSMAAPHVTGSVALLLQNFPELTPNQVITILQNSASAIPNGHWQGDNTLTIEDNKYWGAGKLDIYKAYQSLVGFVYDESFEYRELFVGAYENSITLTGLPISPVKENWAGIPYLSIQEMTNGALYFNDSEFSDVFWIGEGIWDKWIEIDSTISVLGLPISTEYPDDTNNNYPHVLFENGQIFWDGDEAIVDYNELIIVADFSANITQGFVPQEVSFTDESFGYPTNWLWQFGDGTISIDQNPSHLYNHAGVYSVSLRASNSTNSDFEVKPAIIQLMSENIINLPPVIDLNKPSGEETAKTTRIYGDDNNDQSGTSVSCGDVNGDGYSDVIIGAPEAGYSHPGEVYIIYGSAEILDITSIDLSGEPNNITRVFCDEDGYRAGYSLANGDVNGDGYADVIIGSRWGLPSKTYILYGSPTINNVASIQLDGPTTIGTHIYDVYDNSGKSVSCADINGDGFADVLIGAPNSNPVLGGDAAGETYIVYGFDSIQSTSSIYLSNTTTGVSFIHGENAGDNFGVSVSSGDINGDGYFDLIIGANRAALIGQTYIIYGHNGMQDVVNLELSGLTNSVTRIVGKNPGDNFGNCVTNGDINGDGYSDVVIAANYAEPSGGLGAGETYFIYGSPQLENVSSIDLNNSFVNITRVSGDDSGERLGTSVSGGDINGDGFFDVMIGASYASHPVDTIPAGINRGSGESYIVYGSPALTNFENINLLNYSDSFTQIWGDNDGDDLGRSASSGDVNGDGFEDVIVGAEYGGSFDRGATYVIYGGIDVNAPTTPKNLFATTSDDSIRLVWSPNEESDLWYYILYKGSNSSEVDSIAFVNSPDTTYLDLDVQNGMAYEYSISAVDVAGNRSPRTDNINVVAFPPPLANFTPENPQYGLVPYTVNFSDLSTSNTTSWFWDFGDGCTDSVQNPSHTYLHSGLYSVYLRASNIGGSDTNLKQALVWVRSFPIINLPGLVDLNETQGGEISLFTRAYGEAFNDNSGKSVASGDINGDGFDDIIIGAPYSDPNGNNGAGVTYIFYGFAEVNDVTPFNLDEPPSPVTKIFSNSAASNLGGSVSTGDVNNDGYTDLIIGANRATPLGRQYAGESYIVYGYEEIIYQQNIDLGSITENLTKIYGVKAGDQSGTSVFCDDIDSDGFDDVIIGAPLADPALRYSAGETYIVYGSALLKDETSIDLYESNLPLTRIYGDYSNGKSGWNISTADFNGDGAKDIILGSYNADLINSNSGGNYVIYGFRGIANIPGIDLRNPIISVTQIYGEGENDLFGSSVAGRDINGDGYEDVIVGAPYATQNEGLETGVTYIVYGSSDKHLMTNLWINGTTANTTRIIGIDRLDYLGCSVSTGDINGDGYGDVFMGAKYADPVGGYNAGESYVVYGNSELYSTANIFLNQNINNITSIYGDDGNDNLGTSIGAGDINADGLDDIIIGAPNATNLTSENYAGEVNIIYGRSSILSSPPNWTSMPDTFFYEDDSLSINLDDWVSDDIDPDSILVISVTGNFRIRASIDSTIHVLKLITYPDLSGFHEQFFLTATDSYGLFKTDTIIVSVLPLNDTPYMAQPLDSSAIDEDAFGAVVVSGLEAYFADVDSFDVLSFSKSVLDPGLDSVQIGTPDPVLLRLWGGRGTQMPVLKRSAVKAERYASVMRMSDREDGPRMKSLAPSVMSPAKTYSVLRNDGIREGDSTSLIVYPTLNFNGTVRIEITATDDSGSYVIDTLALDIQAINDPPYFVQTYIDASMNEDTSLSIPMWAEDDDGDSLSYEVYSDTSSVSVSYGDSTVWISPEDNWNGSAILTFFVSDTGLTVLDTLMLTIYPVNDAPMLVIDSLWIQEEDTEQMITYAISDVDGDTLELRYTDIEGVEFIHSATMIQVVPDGNWYGERELIVSVSDQDTTVHQDVHLSVLPRNDTPYMAQPLDSSAIDEDAFGAVVVSGLEAYFADVDSFDVLSFSKSVLDPGLDSVQIGTPDPVLLRLWGGGGIQMPILKRSAVTSMRPAFTMRRSDGENVPEGKNLALAGMRQIQNYSVLREDGLREGDSTSLVVFPTLNFNGSVRIEITATDDSGSYVIDTLTLDIQAINDAPVFVQTLYDTSMDEDASLSFPLWAVDDDSDIVSYEVYSDTSAVSVTYADSTVWIILEDNWNGSALVTFFVSDTGLTTVDTLLLTIHPVNDAPAYFALTQPETGTIVAHPDSTEQTFIWDAALDVEGDDILYELWFSSNTWDTTILEIDTNLYRLNVEDFTRGVDVKWSVIASDQDTFTLAADTSLIRILEIVGVDPELALPDVYVLEQNYPNPFNPTTTIKYGLPESSDVTLLIYDIRGREIFSIEVYNQDAGWYELMWNGQDGYGSPVASGIYLTRMQAGSYSKVIKMLYLK